MENQDLKVPLGAFPGNLVGVRFTNQVKRKWFEIRDKNVADTWSGAQKWRQTGPNEITFQNGFTIFYDSRLNTLSGEMKNGTDVEVKIISVGK